jgi:hypothetical protein
VATRRCAEEGLGSLRAYFAAMYGGEGSAAFKLAQRNFVHRQKISKSHHIVAL